jgi:excinuclease ABC subunit C
VTETPKFDPQTFLRNLTTRPGTYRMLNDKGKVVYVGKAQNLKKRVSSYFQKQSGDAKTASLMNVVKNVEVTVTGTEAEALLLEYNLIKQHKPKFNVTLRDDKSYPYIYVSTQHPFPRLEFHRGPRKGSGKYFGPYPSTGAVRKTLNELQKLFMIRQCQDSYFANRTRPCLQYQIQRCTAPCVGLIGGSAYAEDIQAAIEFLEGRNRKVINTLVDRMEQAAVAQDYERAARFRDQISSSTGQAEQHVPTATGTRCYRNRFDRGTHCVTVLFVRRVPCSAAVIIFPGSAWMRLHGRCWKDSCPSITSDGRHRQRSFCQLRSTIAGCSNPSSQNAVTVRYVSAQGFVATGSDGC